MNASRSRNPVLETAFQPQPRTRSDLTMSFNGRTPEGVLVRSRANLRFEMRFRPSSRLSRRPLYFTGFAGLVLVATQSCSAPTEEPEPLPRCVTLDPDCSLLYQPIYSEIHRRTFAATCAEPGTSCHSSEGRRAGLALEDIDEAYELLLDPEHGRVVPGDPECSRIMVRLEHPGSSVMPPGDPLPEAERCTIATWIRNGAPRD